MISHFHESNVNNNKQYVVTFKQWYLTQYDNILSSKHFKSFSVKHQVIYNFVSTTFSDKSERK